MKTELIYSTVTKKYLLIISSKEETTVLIVPELEIPGLERLLNIKTKTI